MVHYVRAGAFAIALVVYVTSVGRAGAPQAGDVQQINLAEHLAAGKLRAVNREVTPLPERPGAVRVGQRSGNGLIWVEGVDFAEGTIEADVRGKDIPQQSFVGLAFHGQEETYEAVYLRPFNFRATDPVRRDHAVQYIAPPGFDWPRLRKEFPEEFENPVDQSIVPTDWVPLRIVVKGKTIAVYVGPASSPTLEVRKLGTRDRGMVGLWTGNNSEGDFANLRITPAR